MASPENSSEIQLPNTEVKSFSPETEASRIKAIEDKMATARNYAMISNQDQNESMKNAGFDLNKSLENSFGAPLSVSEQHTNTGVKTPDTMLGVDPSEAQKAQETAQGASQLVKAAESKTNNPDQMSKVVEGLKGMVASLPESLRGAFSWISKLIEGITGKGNTNTDTLAKNEGVASDPNKKEDTEAEKGQKEALLKKLDGTELQIGKLNAKLDMSKVTLEKNPNSDTYRLKSTQTGFNNITTPIDVNADGKIIAPKDTITLANVPWYGPIKNGDYKIAQDGKKVDITLIT